MNADGCPLNPKPYSLQNLWLNSSCWHRVYSASQGPGIETEPLQAKPRYPGFCLAKVTSIILSTQRDIKQLELEYSREQALSVLAILQLSIL